MAYDVFTDGWLQSWCENINSNETYRDAAQDLDWRLILKMTSGPGTALAEDRAVYADLQSGRCNGCRTATSEDFENASYIITADANTWKKIIDGDLDMLTGIMWGKIKLEKGDLGMIAKHVSAAKQLIVSAIKVDTVFPENI